VYRLIQGDCRDVLPTLEPESVDCVVTDPPYGIGFMGKDWDKALPPTEAFAEMYRVLKPGALAFVMSSPRQDVLWRMLKLLEDCGFELKQSFVSWIYKSGFPKAYDVSKGIDKRNRKPQRSIELEQYLTKKIREKYGKHTLLAEEMGIDEALIRHWIGKSGKQFLIPTKEKYLILKNKLILDDRFDELINWEEAKREIIGKIRNRQKGLPTEKGKRINFCGGSSKHNFEYLTKPALSEAKKWQGWKSVTGLKSAQECVLMVNKPLGEMTIVDNVLVHGVDAMNVDACRIPFQSEEDVREAEGKNAHADFGSGSRENRVYGQDLRLRSEQGNYNSQKGRFPANLLVSDGALDTGKITKYQVTKGLLRGKSKFFKETSHEEFKTGYPDMGDQSRFFDVDAWAEHHGLLQVPKASKRERNEGLEGFPEKEIFGNYEDTSKMGWTNAKSSNRIGHVNKRKNFHPTVKPVVLGCYLIQLGCPPNGVVLDPFVGTGTFMKSAMKLGRSCIAIETEPDYCVIARERCFGKAFLDSYLGTCTFEVFDRKALEVVA